METIASKLQAIARRLAAIASRLEAIASRVEAIASRVQAIAGWRPSSPLRLSQRGSVLKHGTSVATSSTSKGDAVSRLLGFSSH